MFKKISNIILIVIFSVMLLLPLLTTNLQNEKVSESEKRKLAPQPVLYTEEGRNKHFIADFEKWLNDNIGFRSSMVINNARMQYYGFNVLSNNSNYLLGPEGELNYANSAIITDFQRNNIYGEEYLKQFANSAQILADYTRSQGAEIFYYQCWDKHSIYPEYFPRTVVQHGKYSKTDGIIEALEKETDITVISPKEELIQAKSETPTYSVWGDPTHWNDRGAYIGYRKLMQTIAETVDASFCILNEDDYDIEIRDTGMTVFGGIHEVDQEEVFTPRNLNVKQDNEKLTLYREDSRHSYWVNAAADNDLRVLIIGDSYFNSFIIKDIAESFHETVLIWGDYLNDTKGIIDAYHPDIVIIEAAERVDRTGGFIKGANEITND